MYTHHGTRITLFTLLLVCLLGQGKVFAQSAEVMAVTPPEVKRGTSNLDVTISGDGFDEGSQVIFLVSGTTESGGITVNSTQFMGSGKLDANISIDECAGTGKFDIEVQSATSGRRGKGNTLMSVLAASVADGSLCEEVDESRNGTTDFNGDVQGAFIEHLGGSDSIETQDLEGRLTGDDTMTLTGDAAIVLMFFDDECRHTPADPALCSDGASEKGVLPLGTQRLPQNCDQTTGQACSAVRFDASTGLEWDIHLDHDEQAADRVQFQLKWYNENGEQHFLRAGWLVPGGSLLPSDFGESLEPGSNSLRSATVEFLAVPFRLEGELLVDTNKETEDFVYSEYGEDGTTTFSIHTSVP